MQNEFIEPTGAQRELALVSLRIALGDRLPAMLPIDVVSEQMGIEVSTARNWIYRNRFPMHTQRVGGRISVPLLELVRWLALQYPVGEVLEPVQTDTLRRRPGRPRKIGRARP